MPSFRVLFNNLSKPIDPNEETLYCLERIFRRENATREEIESCLEQTRHDPCCFSLEKFFEGERAHIELISQEGEYYMMYSDTRDTYGDIEGDIDEDIDGDLIIKNYWNRKRSGEKIVEFGGEYLQDFLICDDFNDVKEIFRQFLDEDRVSEELMD